MPKRIVLFASGTGSNARAIADYFEHRTDIEVDLVLSNKASAGVLKMAQKRGILTRVFDRSEFSESTILLKELQELSPDLIVLAGFLWLVPATFVAAFPKQIINVHPGPLPQFGGKGMYGLNVHKAVLEAQAAESGPTFHYVNEHFDEGEIIFRATCPVLSDDTAEKLAQRVLTLEHCYFPQVVDHLLTGHTIQ